MSSQQVGRNALCEQFLKTFDLDALGREGEQAQQLFSQIMELQKNNTHPRSLNTSVIQNLINANLNALSPNLAKIASFVQNIMGVKKEQNATLTFLKKEEIVLKKIEESGLLQILCDKMCRLLEEQVKEKLEEINQCKSAEKHNLMLEAAASYGTIKDLKVDGNKVIITV